MKRMHALKRTTALILAVIFTFTMALAMTPVPAYAASKPAKVTGVKFGVKSNYSIKITWNKAKRAKKYQVYRATAKKGKYKKVATVTGTSFINSNLSKGKKYYYKVRAINGSKKGAFSQIKNASTKKSSLYDVKVDKNAKTVTISAKVNGKFFGKSTRHFMVDRYGFNKDKGMLSSYCIPDDLYNGLVKAGAVSWSKSAGKTLKDGEKNTKKNAENKNFSKIDISVSWGNETHSLEECLTNDDESIEVPKIDMIFSGNPKAAARTPSGCMVCMDSCYIGMVANSSYGLCVIDNDDPTLFARSDVLPPDGTVVKVIFTVK